MEVKAKTDDGKLSTLTGADPSHRGIVTLFEPKPPPFDISGRKSRRTPGLWLPGTVTRRA